tara:strand:- start:13099 stop:13302 length:204 start_codon:yes stop_codon:yes gene_type:complete
MPWSLLFLLAQAGQPFAIPARDSAAELAAESQAVDNAAAAITQQECAISVATMERFRRTRRLQHSCR